MSEQTIPTFDLRDYLGGDEKLREAFVQGVGGALTEVGFFALEGHGVEDDQIQRVYDLGLEVFQLPEAAKQEYERPEVMGQRGYTSFGREHAKDHDAPDLKEFWSVGPDLPAETSPYPPNMWPTEVPAFQEATQSMFCALEALAKPLLEACARYLGEDKDRFRGLIEGGDTLLRVLHYPPVPDDVDPAAVRSAPHEDINLITLLCGASAEGLEIQTRQGEWLPVRAVPGQLIVDSGDMLQNLTNGFYRSTTHRVVNPDNSRQRRFSMPIFVHPRPEVDLTPLPSAVARTGGEVRYPSIDAKTFLHQRLTELGLGA